MSSRWTTAHGFWTPLKMWAVWGSVAVVAVLAIAVFAYGQATWWEDHKTDRGRGDTGVAHVDQDHADTYEMPDTFGNIATKCVAVGKRAWVTTTGGIFITDDPECPDTTWEITNEDES